MSLEPLHANPSALMASIGAVVNIENVHWVALRWLGGKVWLLDSQEQAPHPLAWHKYLEFVQRHKDAYRIEAARAVGAA